MKFEIGDRVIVKSEKFFDQLVGTGLPSLALSKKLEKQLAGCSGTVVSFLEDMRNGDQFFRSPFQVLQVELDDKHIIPGSNMLRIRTSAGRLNSFLLYSYEVELERTEVIE